MAWTGYTFTLGQVLTTAQMNNLSGDIPAVMNGDAGAPSLQQAALRDAATGANASYGNPLGAETTLGVYTKILEVQVPYGGVFNVQFDLAGIYASGSNSVYARIYVDGVATGTERNNTDVTDAYATYNEDVTVTTGQLIQIYAYVSIGDRASVINYYLKEAEPLGFGELL